MNYIYLDNAATTKPHPETLKAMHDAPWGNSSTMSPLGREAAIAVRKVEERLLETIQAPPNSRVIFTGGGSEANDALRKIINTNIIMSKAEHSSMQYEPYYVALKPDRHGQILFTTGHNKLLLYTSPWPYAVMYVNNETGVINDPYRVGYELKAANEWHRYVCDMVQALGKIPIDMSHGFVDFATFSSHKIHGPKGAGAIVIHGKYLKSTALFERRWHPTLNVPAIVGFGKALELLNVTEDYEYINELRELFLEALQEALGHPVVINGTGIPHIINFQSGVEAETLIAHAERAGVIISRGSACTTGDLEPSKVLRAMRLSVERAWTSVRVSFAKTNTREEVVTAGRVIADCINQLKSGPARQVTEAELAIKAKNYITNLMAELGLNELDDIKRIIG